MTLRSLALPVLLLASACGGGGSPSGPGPAAPPTGTQAVSGFVFYDQNGNGAADANETVRLQGVRVTIGTKTATTGGAGQFTVTGLPAGSLTATAPVASLPPYFVPGAPVTVAIPSTATLAVPVTLPIGGNQANRYFAFGDSLTDGAGSSRREGWTVPLERRLRAQWGSAEVLREGIYGMRSIEGAGRLPEILATERPAYTLILIGTNDWTRCQFVAPQACATVGALRDMIRSTRAAGSLPVVGTIPPFNPDYPDLFAADRNEWTRLENDLIRPMVLAEGAVLVDVWAAFGADQSRWPFLFADHVHPNEDGYDRIAGAFFDAITRPRTTP